MPTDYYMAQLAVGQAFERVVRDHLLRIHGVDIGLHEGRAAQLLGESEAGLEIKRDGRFHQTGNLYIETVEKSRPENPCWVSSGIRRTDNTSHYGIGDETRFFIFVKAALVAYQERADPRIIEIPMKTSRGFLLPLTLARSEDLIDREYWAVNNLTEWDCKSYR